MEDNLDLIYKIGRNPDGDLTLQVPDVYESVSRYHVDFLRDHGEYILIDKSSNGTYINGVRIKKAKVNKDDYVQLGSVEAGYILDIDDLIKKLSQEYENRRTDFSQEFRDLQYIYDDYDVRKNKIIKNSRISGMLPRILLSIVMIAAIYFFPIPSDLKYPLIMGVGILGMIVSVMSKTDQSMKKKIEKLVIEYNRKYVCPKCHNKLNIQSKSYNMLLEDGKCPYNNCDAIYRE